MLPDTAITRCSECWISKAAITTATWQVLAASQSPLQKKWFQGTADAVRQYLWLFENSMREGVEDFLILAGARAARSPTPCTTPFVVLAG